MNQDNKMQMFMFQNFTKQTDLWGMSLEGMFTQKMRLKFNILHNAIKGFQAEFDKAVGKSLEDEYHRNSEIVSDCMELIFKEKDPEKKEMLLVIMKEYAAGTLNIIETN